MQRHKREPDKEISIRITGGSVVVEAGEKYEFESLKGFEKRITISRGEYEVV